jgi:hypothetical protein
MRATKFSGVNPCKFFKNCKNAFSLVKISIFEDEVLNDTIGDEVLGWFD